MKKLLSIALLCSIFIFSACRKHSSTKVYPQKFEGLIQLMLVEQTENIITTDTLKKTLIPLLIKSDAIIKTTSNVTYKFYNDFEKDGYSMQFREKGKILDFEAPALRAQDPIVNNNEITYTDKGTLINENKASLQILQGLQAKFIAHGQELATQPHVKQMAETQLRKFLKEFCAKQGLAPETININFGKVQ